MKTSPTHEDISLEINVFKFTRYEIMALARELGVTSRQVYFTLEKEKLTPSWQLGRPSVVSRDQVDELKASITTSRTGPQMSYLELVRVQFRHWRMLFS